MIVSCAILAAVSLLLLGVLTFFALLVVGIRRGDRTYLGNSSGCLVDSITRHVLGVTVRSAATNGEEEK